MGYQVLTCGKLDLLTGELDWGADGQHGAGAASRLSALGFTGGLDSAGKHAVLRAHRAGAEEPYFAHLRARDLAEAHVADFATRRNPMLGPDASSAPKVGENFRNTSSSPLPDDAYQDDWIGECGLDLVRQASADQRPWFLQVNFVGPHEPMNITRSMAESVEDRAVPSPSGGNPNEPHQAIRRAYTAMVERLDEILGRYVSVLAETGQLDETVIVFTSDHGEMLGDCGLWEKFIPYQMSIGIPLIVAGPGVAHGSVEAPATFLDLHATALDLAGAEPIPDVDSRSMAPLFANPAGKHRDVAFSGLGAWRIVFDGRHKLVAGWDPDQGRSDMEKARFDTEDLDLRLVCPADDPCETRDLSDELPELARSLAARLVDNARRGRAGE